MGQEFRSASRMGNAIEELARCEAPTPKFGGNTALCALLLEQFSNRNPECVRLSTTDNTIVVYGSL